MMQLSRVVWSEGMHLGPHHFQAQNRYFEDCIHFKASALWFAPYGLISWSLDAEALRNDTLAVLHASGLFPDGLFFQMPECDKLPEPINLAQKMSPIRNSATVVLAIPRANAGIAKPGAAVNGTRYIGETQILHDENTGGDEKPVDLARKNFRLLLDDELSESERSKELIALPIARVTRDGAGHLRLDPEFIPPCLNAGGSTRLMTMLRRLIDILEEKSVALSEPNRGGTRSFAPQELMKFWFLHTVNSSLAGLRHLYYSKRGHPEELYLAMARLAGALCTFGIKSDPLKVPPYTHDNLTDCFERLDEHVREHLELVIPTNAISIELNRADELFYSGAVTDPRCLGRSRWIFGIESSVAESALISMTPRLVKICSQVYIRELVRRSVRGGLELTHLPQPPAAISPRPEFQYFGVTRSGPCWDHIVETQQIGVYVPADLASPRLELVVVLDNSDASGLKV